MKNTLIVISVFNMENSMKIGNFEIKGYAALAPMAGVADRAYRLNIPETSFFEILLNSQFSACRAVGIVNEHI